MAGIKIIGMDAAIRRMGQVAKEAEMNTGKALRAFGEQVAEQAKTNAPADEGLLRNSISYQMGIGLSVEIVAAVNYAAYLEFGTRKYARDYVATLPSEWKQYAETFKGNGGGNMDDFIQAIMAWAKRKGIGALRTKGGNVSNSAASNDSIQQAAYLIAINILQNGIKPHPFLYPAVNANVKQLKEDLQNVIK